MVALQLGIVFLLGMWGYGLQWHGLVYTSHHEPLFFGPGYLEIKYELPPWCSSCPSW